MKTTYHVGVPNVCPAHGGVPLKRLLGSAVCFGTAALMFAQTSFAQGFISREYRPRWYQEYENFGGYDLRKNPEYISTSYPTSTGAVQTMGVLSRVTYDPFGNFLLPGGNIYNYRWDRSRVGTNYGFDGTYSANVFNNLMISADEFSNWQTRFMIANVSGDGTGMRAYFTPSTLKITNFGGVRWDLSSRKNNITLLVENRGGPTAQNLYGIHWQSILGDILKVGGTFVARQRGTLSYSHTDIDNGPTGMRSTPRYIYLVLSDDSPEDRDNGPRIYNIRVRVNGADITSQIPKRVFKITDLLNRRRYFNNAFQKQYIFGADASGFFPQMIESYIANTDSWFLSVMNTSQRYNDIFSKTAATNNFGQINLADPNNPTDPTGRYFAADPSLGFQEATGTDVVIYEFLVPYETRDLKFDILAANDYNVDIIAALYRQTQSTEAKWEDQPLTAAWNDTWSVFYDAKNAVKATGNVKDYSNTKWVTVSYDRLAGMNVYGLDAQLNWRGLYVNAEINEYNSLWSYPLEEHLSGAAKNEITARAWFVNIEKDFGKWSFGGELYNYPNNYMRWWAPIDDNDDDDAYGLGGNGTDPDGDQPGYDVDWDRQLDTAYSGTQFLTYYFDNVVFGDDFNHNGVIDARENDSAIDLPYERNSKGQHYFVKLKPQEKTLFTLGYYDITQGTLVGRNQTDYFKFQHFQSLQKLGEISLQHRSEFIRYNYLLYPIASDSYGHKTLLHTRLKPVESLNVINDLLFGWSKSWGPIVRSRPNTIIEHQMKFYPVKENRQSLSFGFVHKADYTIQITDRRLIPDIYFRGYRIMKEKRIKEFKFQPMIKLENSYWTAFNVRLSRYYTHHTYNLYPIIRLDYRVAPNTMFRCGFQGFPGFNELYRVGNVKTYYEYALSEYDRKRMIFAFENRTLYSGFNLVVLMGIQKDKWIWKDPRGRKQPGSTQYFIRLQSESTR